MVERWKLLNEVKQVAPGVLEGRALVPEDSTWFSGHFPGEPILPGIAVLGVVYEAIERDARERGESVIISSLKRVRFTGPVRPGDSLSIDLTREDGQEEILINFKAAVGETVICTGQMVVMKNA